MKTSIILFANLKGGVGKSSFANWTSVYLKRYTKHKCITIDCDMMQQSLIKARAEDIVNYDGDDFSEVDAYELRHIDPENFFEVFSTEMDEVYDYVLIDVPGHVASASVKQMYLMGDVIIVPTDHTQTVVDGTREIMGFINEVVKKRKQGGFETKVRLFFNKVPFLKVKENTTSIKAVNELIEQVTESLDLYKFPVMETKVAALVSTGISKMDTVNIDDAFYKKYFKKWFAEFETIIKK